MSDNQQAVVEVIEQQAQITMMLAQTYRMYQKLLERLPNEGDRQVVDEWMRDQCLRVLPVLSNPDERVGRPS